MRFFPRSASRRLVAASAACTLAVGALAIPLANAEDLKHKQKQVQHQIHSASHDLDESSSQLRRAAAALEHARARLSGARAHLAAVRSKLDAARIRDAEMQAKLAAAVERLENARADVLAGEHELEDQRVAVTGTITSIYEEGDPELIAFSSLLDAQSPADLTRRMEARNVIVGRETRAYDGLHAAEVLLKVRENEVEAARNEVAVQREAAAEHLVVMKHLRDEARDAKVRVRAEVVKSRAARRQASKARRHDLAQLHELRARENKIRQQILEAARNARGGYRGETDGFLNRPVPGVITSPYGYRMHPIYHYWGLHDGDDFSAGCGEPLWAAASGTVMAEYYSSVWGNRLYLNVGQVNGRNVTVVYNHLSGYRVGTGQHVGRGDVVGYAGTTGWSTGCHLHFTVLVNGVPKDPTNWF